MPERAVYPLPIARPPFRASGTCAANCDVPKGHSRIAAHDYSRRLKPIMPHGALQLTLPKSNKERKRRKLGFRPPGRSGRKKAANTCYLDKAPTSTPNAAKLISMQPHRRSLPERFREDSRGGTVLGMLLLTGQLGPHERDGKPSDRATKLYEAGNRYAVIVGQYRAMIGVPRGVSGAGKGYDCHGQGELQCDMASCECVRRRQAYNSAYGALYREGRIVAMVVARVAIHDEPIHDELIPILTIGLGTLELEFGLRH